MTSDNKKRKNNGRSNSTAKRSTSGNKGRTSAGRSRSTSTTGRKRTASSKQIKQNEEYEFDYVKVLMVICAFACFVLLFLFSINIFTGKIGMAISNFLHGILGINSYVLPILLIVLLLYVIFFEMTKKMIFNIIFSFVFDISIGMIAHCVAFHKDDLPSEFGEFFGLMYHNKSGGGLFTGSFSYLIDKAFGRPFVIVLAVLFIVTSISVIFGKYLVYFTKLILEKYTTLDDGYDKDEVRENIRKVRGNSNEKEEKSKKKPSFTIKQDNDTNDKENDAPEIIDVNPEEIKSIFDSDENEKEDVVEVKESNDIHAVKLTNKEKDITDDYIAPINIIGEDIQPIRSNVKSSTEEITTICVNDVKEESKTPQLTANSVKMLDFIDNSKPETNEIEKAEETATSSIKENTSDEKKKDASKYKFPPVSLLKKSDNSKSKSSDNIYETARKLKETLETFGVKVEIDANNCSKGPSVTRYELIPAPGVKVSRIVSLSDDIKLNLGAADIRIEAPIPGKSAVGIEVPNTESSTVPFRDLIESNEFSGASSRISFAVGKDLAGKVVIADIAKMPHMLIAGATGSGKSVCINSIIMSILYKARPDEVKLILIDPKVVELSVYNGIPHLLLPVVTDPKKASGSLHWGVSEMESRYKKFAEAEVRDLKGYNEKAKSDTTGNMSILPQIVIIVDELADLMMVAGKEVEESICRLAQLARAAGIHLIIATQRPSVDVITGLIKANMPSRIAFSVSSGIDSRTILDSNGAEKLLGKGDMLFFPQGYNKPARVQGCFVSDKEVSDVVDFIKNQNIAGYDERVAESISIGGNSVVEVPGGDIDELFPQAGEFIIGKEKASIGALQRAFKIGFNRAARIMDQLEAKGVVGPEEGTKPRKILMNNEQFEELIASLNK